MIFESIALIVVIALGGVVFLALRKPDEFRVKREGLIDAPASAVFPYLNNLEKWQIWSPWVAMEPDANYVFEGPIEGVGAVLFWEGKKTGKGKMTIIESVPDNLVRFRLEFFKPMQAVNTCDYTLSAQGDQTRFDWEMYGPNNFKGKILSVFMNCEKMCGDQFEKGIASLKTIVEKAPSDQKAA